jgi:hypothetical protein
MNATVHTLKNDTRLEEFEQFVKDQGKASAMGDEALPVFAIGFVRAVYDGVVDVAKDANGDDASTRYFKKYAAAEGKKKFHDRSTNSQKAQVSKLKQLEKAASNPKFDFVDVLNRGVTIRQQAVKDGIEVKSPFPAYVDLAREQLKQDDELTDDVIYSTVVKSDTTKEKTLEGELKAIAKKLEKIVTGENADGIIDQSPEVLVAAEQINQRIKSLMMEQDKALLIAKAGELGMSVNEEEPAEYVTAAM